MRTAVRLTVATVSVLAIAAFIASRMGEKGTPAPDVPTARPIRVLPPDSVIAGPVDTQATIGAYTLRVLRDTAAGDQIVDIARGGHRVFAVRAFGARLELVGRDLTGDRSPDVVVRQYSGGMHCCSQATVLGLGPTLVNYGTIDGADGDIEFDDIDNDGVMEAKVNDFRFAYWRDYAFVETQAPDVILRFRGGGYQPACDLMREDAPDNATLNRRARELTDGWNAGNPPAEFWGYAVDLIYGGQADLAWHWLDRAWPRAIGGKDEFLGDLRDKLRGSPCWSPPHNDRVVS
jgi:hypothetical protein